MNKLIELDKEVFLFLNNLGSPTWDTFWLTLTNKWASIPLYLLLLYFAYQKLTKKQLLYLLLFVALLITATDQLANFFKYGVARLRPCHDETLQGLVRLVKESCGGRFGYFSAHAANSFAVATFFSILFKKQYSWLPFLLIVWALSVAYSRIYIGVHFPLDVITGISFGMLLGWLFSYLLYKLYRVI